MTTLTLDLPPELYQSLETEANRHKQTPAILVQNILQDHLHSLKKKPTSDRAEIERVLAKTGAVAELGPTLAALADPTISLEEVSAALSRFQTLH